MGCSMKFLYTTDLHGDENKYKKVLQYAVDNGYNTVHIGADLLPKGSELLKIQKKFIKGFLKEWCQEAWSHDILVMCSFGNDDLYSRKKYAKEIGLSLLEETRVIDAEADIKFKAYPWVPIHPFGLLNGCKLDKPNSFGNLPVFYNRPTDLNEQGQLDFVQNMEAHITARRSIAEDLEQFDSDNRTIVAIHSPPAGLDLDVCYDGRKVGSVSVRDWIETHEAMLVLCGHIHESPQRTGIWKAQAMNGTWVVQPGQYGSGVIVVEIDTENLDAMKRISL
jgi:Icc-related predicted phosphoesterase